MIFADVCVSCKVFNLTCFSSTAVKAVRAEKRDRRPAWSRMREADRCSRVASAASTPGPSSAMAHKRHRVTRGARFAGCLGCISTACQGLHIGQMCRRSVPCKVQARECSGTLQQMDPCPMSESSCCMPGAMQIHALRQVLQAEALLQPLMQRQYTEAAASQQQHVTSSQGACRQIRRGHPYSANSTNKFLENQAARACA